MEGNVETLVLENAQLRGEIAELTKRVEILAEQNAWLKQRFFGRSSEALSLEEQRVTAHDELTGAGPVFSPFVG